MNDSMHDIILRTYYNPAKDIVNIKLSRNGSYYMEFLKADGTLIRVETFGAGEQLSFFEELAEDWKNGINKQFLCE